ncbi:Abscisic acid G-protein coupled receptor-domain-containing protein [Kockovaella imperatae]|uniref:Abscisic acid G-protein coupled receptor-domain-containing protein n=1 Tax=Kockovaella imperatae TaxID=4999 RepID=A0A1Y1UCH7_9TREE|nr:Abscisic acid G-protein coupled receptor-domain-containing protein [Kockovaella imperatae]ORX35751.1 Abscisic acid G-protein coupled receptor-domain-containing protein [Kockovaella imperatae]
MDQDLELPAHSPDLPLPSSAPIPLPPTAGSPLLRDTLCLLLLRAIYFYLARRFLQHSLSTALRDLSKPLLPLHSATTPESADKRSGDDSDNESSPSGSTPGSPAITSLLLPETSSTGFSTPTEGASPTIELSDLDRRVSERVRAKGDLPTLNVRHKGGATAKQGTRQLSRAARFLFCYCFSEGCTVLSIVAFQLSDIFDDRSRHINFSISLHTILVLVLLVLPMVQCVLLTYRSRDSTSLSTSTISFPVRLGVALLPFGLYCFLFSCIPPYLTAVDADSTGWHWLSPLLGRLLVLGIVSLAGLSGYGAVRTAWIFYEHARGISGDKVTKDDIIRTERSLYKVRQDLAERRSRLGTKTKGSWFARDGLSGLRAETAGLEAMHSEIVRELETLKKRKSRQDYGASFHGRVYHFIGQLFAVYCASRVLMCLPSVFFAPGTADRDKGNTNGDWISFLLALGVSQLRIPNFNVALWSRAISLLLTGLIVLGSLAQILRSVGRVIRLTSKTAAVGFFLLSLGQLFSTYVISLLVQMRSSLQEDTDSLLVSLPDFRVFGRLFDLVFLFAAAGTLAYKYVAMKVTGDV